MPKLIDNLETRNLILFNDKMAVATYNPSGDPAALVIKTIYGEKVTYSTAALAAVPESPCVFETARGDSIELLSYCTKQLR